MSVVWILCTGVGYLALLAVLLFFVHPKADPQWLQTIVNSVGLPLPVEIVPTVVATQRRAAQATFLSTAIGVVLATVGVLLAHVQAFPAIFFLGLTTTFLAIGIGSAIATVLLEDARHRGQVRLARLRSVGLADFRGTVERWTPRGIVVLALAAFSFRVAVSPGGIPSTPPFLFACAGAMVISLAISEGASRSLVKRGPPAVSAPELAWDDAVRARAFNPIALTPFYLGGYFNIASIASYSNSRSEAVVLAAQLSVGVELLFASGLRGWAILSAKAKHQQRFLRRLWLALASAPTVAAPTVAAPTAATAATQP